MIKKMKKDRNNPGELIFMRRTCFKNIFKDSSGLNWMNGVEK